MKKRFVAFSATVRDVRRTKREGEETGEDMKKKRAEEDKERGHRGLRPKTSKTRVLGKNKRQPEASPKVQFLKVIFHEQLYKYVLCQD